MKMKTDWLGTVRGFTLLEVMIALTVFGWLKIVLPPCAL
jgi:prepilin-type N-terminal cleavage/methylation domain-containing protein